MSVRIIRKQRPDALLRTVGGQTALNLTIALDDSGIIQECGAEMIGAKREAIREQRRFDWATS